MLKTPRARALSGALMLSLLTVPVAHAQEGMDAWALDGNDPIGYFEGGAVMSGRSDLSLEWRGRLYHFASEDNLMRFESNPRSYTPQFEGLCVVALSEGRRVAGDPSIFVLYQGELFLMQDEVSRALFLSNPDLIIHDAAQSFGR